MSSTGHRHPHPIAASFRDLEPERFEDCYLAGSSIAIRRVRSQLQRIAPYFRIALITGEPGTGKQTLAHALHQSSPGNNGPFVPWHATELVDRLLPDTPTADILREAHCGTLFLDEIDRVPFSLQSRLVHLLHQPDVQRCDLRIIASSNRELRTLAATGQFRDELYRRIAAAEITLPPLRTRPEDIPAIATALLQHITDNPTLTPEALTHLQHHPWPHNIRELRETLQKATTQAGGAPIDLHHLPLPKPQQPENEHSLERLQDVVQRHVLDVLTRCSGNKLRASEVLGISRSTLYRMLDANTAAANPRYPG
ncbi:sigma-54-dependent transcriptional regulator [Granulicella arctica]|uniref:DNA-binding NtrC family response regulator n=1 Tax=Granulicella arctica TaxID=940613 RepID=A0A7Y9TGY1_9BACT|nr:sigma 54-interacting transcriptional regulator [Granulicella arctica]NYF79959.1 DNA-binding NtrC family response regulator [Granulicella arctica]